MTRRKVHYACWSSRILRRTNSSFHRAWKGAAIGSKSSPTGNKRSSLLQKDDFDVVLMDAEMPVMDGFEATAAIRRLSRAEKAHVPIIAVTAHASPEDQDRCQTAGMDAYIHKPIDLGELIQLIESLLGKSDAPHGEPAASSGGVPEGAASAASPDSALFDLDEAVSRSLGRYELFRQMVGYFYAEADAIVARIREAIAGGNADDVAQLAHRLKGTILYLGSPPALKAAAQVERIGRSGQLATAGEALDRLEALIGLLKQVLVAHRDGAVPGPSDRPGL